MSHDRLTHLARTVIETEAAMISQLVHRIDPTFLQACDYLHDCKGRIIVMGVGKSGHIGKKIAATFASTGSPSFFVHPSEAKHGDIGMLTKHDVILALSNSGETEEILTILPFIKRLGLPLISMTGKPTSTLAKTATLNLDVSVEKEACPLGLAPTSSTTAALVMGDALAMTLLDKRGFTENDFALTHPGGALGRRLLLRVKDIMHQTDAIPLVTEKASLKEALIEMTQKKLGATTVVTEEGVLCGILTDGDIRRTLNLGTDIHQTKVHEVMSPHPKTISREMLAAEALNLMETHQITLLIVANELHHPIGVLHVHDILRSGVM